MLILSVLLFFSALHVNGQIQDSLLIQRQVIADTIPETSIIPTDSSQVQIQDTTLSQRERILSQDSLPIQHEIITDTFVSDEWQEMITSVIDSLETLPDAEIPELETRQDTLNYLQQSIKPHSPHKATIYAMIAPGWGQLYNRQWWKLPILYGGVGATIYGLTWNNTYYKRYKTAYKDYYIYLEELAENPDLPYPADNSWDKLLAAGRTAEDFSSTYQNWFRNQLNNRKTSYKRNRDLLYIVMAGIYVVQIIDACVFAHFFNFEINEDLTLDLLPVPSYSPVTGGSVGLYLTITF